ncbi:ankyrin repeat domain-containing protein [Wolbachia pipientis]|uniref:ankyrin repeat domain-containing protein n=1 Tax=Wolbachia pipientis TaxID=955 RepID=UPI0025A33E42|nr:ankyrin repeat domain-containing protein [Wolbachia pipientis]MDM8335451.1 ankyrin repeat domain-containing protein [Wolbachia pipientis]
MVNDTITLIFKIEKGEPIDRHYFSARIKLGDESKNLLREKLSSTIQFDNLDNYLDLNHENFYIYYNKYGGYYGRSELYVKSNDGRFLTSNLPLNYYRFSIELSSDGTSIIDYGFYPLAVIYNPHHYDKAKEKVFDDHGELSPIASSVLDNFLSNTNNLTTQEIFLQLQNEAAEKGEKLIREKRQAEKELDKKNEKLEGLIKKGEITLFKVVKGHDIGDGRSAVILQRDGQEVILDSSKYYIAEYEDSEFLHCDSSSYDILLDHNDLFFVLNRSSYPELESGFYSINEFNSDSYAKYLDTKNQLFSDNQLLEKVSYELEEDSNQVDTKFTINDEQVDEEVVVASEAKFRGKRAGEENDEEEKVSNSVSTQAKSEGKKITVVELEESSASEALIQKLFSNDDLNAKDSMGYTALHKAVFSKRFDEVKLLIDKGARVDVQDKHGLTPLFYSVMNNDEKMIKLLVETGNANVNLGKYNNPLGIAITRGYIKSAEYLINKGANLDQQDSIGRTLLHKAAEDGNLAAVKFLIDHGARLDVLDTWNNTPLHVAANVKVNKGHIEIADYLIKNGANINLTHNYTPIHLAITRGNLDMVKCLIDNGADLYIKRACDGTPLAYAKQQGQVEIVNYMDSVMSNLSRNKTISLDTININIKYDLASNKLNMVEKSIKDAVQNFKSAFNISGHDIKINAYIFNTQNDFKEYLKKIGLDAGNGVNGYTKMIDLSKGNAVDVYVYLDSEGNLNQHTLEHEIGHAMHFANLGLSYILPKAMHEAIANYVAGLESGRHINDHGDKEALVEIINKDLKPDEILRDDYQGKHYYSEAEQVVKFLEYKHPDLIDNLLKSLSNYGYHDRSQGNKLVEDFLAELKSCDQEFKEWVKVQLSSEEYSQHKDMKVNQPTIDLSNEDQHGEQQEQSKQKRAIIDKDKQETVMTSVIENMDNNFDNKVEDPNSIANAQHPLKIKTGEPLEMGKYKAVLEAQDQDMDNFYQNLSSQYTAGKYNYDQMIDLYNNIYIQNSKLDGKPIILSEAYVTNNHLFIKNQDFGTLDDFNEMFYKSNELM